MTKEEAQARSREKSQAIDTLCKQLQVVITAEQMITQEGFIKNVVYHNDVEKYDIDKEPKEKPNEVQNEKKDSEPDKVPPADIRK